jgi:hypothetical protein
MELGKLIGDLGLTDDHCARLEAVKALGAISGSDEAVVRGLLKVKLTDPLLLVREASVAALDSEANRAVLRSNPGLVDEVESEVKKAGERIGGQVPLEGELESYKKNYDWFCEFRTTDERMKLCTKDQLPGTLRKEMLDGFVCVDGAIDVHAKDKNGQWSAARRTVRDLSMDDFSLRALYEPVRNYALAGLKWGALAGIAWKFIDSFIGLASVNMRVAILFLICAGAIIGGSVFKKSGMGGVVILLLIPAAMKLGVSIGSFLGMIVSVVLTGALLGCLPGMAIGGVVGLARRAGSHVAKNATPEPASMLFKVIVLPLAGGAGLWCFYILVVMPWLVRLINS